MLIKKELCKCVSTDGFQGSALTLISGRRWVFGVVSDTFLLFLKLTNFNAIII